MTDQSSWQSFWENADRHGKDNAGINDARLASTWRDCLALALAHRAGPLRMLDMACGDGAVSRLAQSVATDSGTALDITCLDIAPAAVQRAISALPAARGVVASAADTGLDSGSFDLIVSQFGLEYADGGLDEALRLLAPDGELLLLQHRSDSAIDKESRDTLAALDKVLASELFAAFIRLVEEGREWQRGNSTLEACEEADRQLSPQVKYLEEVLNDYGKGVAGGVLYALYRDIARMYQRMGHYAAAEVIDWTGRARDELGIYRERMATMRQAALDETAIESQRQLLQTAGLRVTRCEAIALADGRAAAWLTVARRT